jgi:hypothetical protein
VSYLCYYQATVNGGKLPVMMLLIMVASCR